MSNNLNSLGQSAAEQAALSLSQFEADINVNTPTTVTLDNLSNFPDLGDAVSTLQNELNNGNFYTGTTVNASAIQADVTGPTSFFSEDFNNGGDSGTQLGQYLFPVIQSMSPSGSAIATAASYSALTPANQAVVNQDALGVFQNFITEEAQQQIALNGQNPPPATPPSVDLATDLPTFASALVSAYSSTYTTPGTPTIFTPSNSTALAPAVQESFQAAYKLYFPSGGQVSATTNPALSYQNLLQQYQQQAQAAAPLLTPLTPGTSTVDVSAVSQNFIGWAQFLGQEKTAAFKSAGLTDLDMANPDQTKILNEIYALLVGIIDIVQNVAAAQAQRLNTLTEWQQAYSDAANQITTFVSGDQTGIGKSSMTDTTYGDSRNAGNTEGTSWRNTIQARQGEISDLAKALQSSINQSNDDATAQATAATSFIQTMTSIIGSVFPA